MPGVFLSMLLNHVLLGTLWIVYCVLHSVLASLSVKVFFQKRLGKGFKHYRLGYTIFAFAGLVGIIWFQLSMPSVNIYAPNPFTKILGGIIGASGLVLMFICIKKYFLNLSGLRSLAQEETYAVLEIRGVHRYVRHPLYSGTFLAIWGLFFLFPTASVLLTDVIITSYTLLALKFEEKKLVLQFGESYQMYQRKVPQIIPKF